MFDIKENIMNRLKNIARNSPYYACNLLRNMVLYTISKGSSIALRFPNIQNVWNFVVELREIYKLKKYGLFSIYLFFFINDIHIFKITRILRSGSN